MKRFLGFLLAVLLLLTACAALAEDSGSTLVLPSKLKTIRAEAFANNKSITRVMIPKTIEKIEAKAFSGCTNLKEIYIGKSKKLKIAKNAFRGCENATFYVYAGTPGEMFALYSVGSV